MKVIIACVLMLTYTLSIADDEVQERIDVLVDLMYSDPDSAIILSHSLLQFSEENNEDRGIVEANYFLAYIYSKFRVNQSKSIIYYLEAIRHAEKSSYKNVDKTLISLHKNCANIFADFKAYDLAIQYYSKGIEFATKINSEKQINSITYNMSSLYEKIGHDEKAILTLERISKNLQPDNYLFFDLNNRLSIYYIKVGSIEKAEQLAKKLLLQVDPGRSELIDTYQVLGRVAKLNGDLKDAEYNFNLALKLSHDVEKEYSRHKAFLENYNYLGKLYFDQGKYEKATAYFKEAEQMVTLVPQKPEFISVYKSAANSLFESKKYEEAKRYEDKYYNALNDYLRKQEEMQEANKKYNMDLITRSYFDEVAKQERIATILLYSKMISGSLLLLLLLNIGYNRYQKVKLRRSIREELVDLKVLS